MNGPMGERKTISAFETDDGLRTDFHHADLA